MKRFALSFLALGLISSQQMIYASGKCGFGQAPCDEPRGCCVIGDDWSIQDEKLNSSFPSETQVFTGYSYVRGAEYESCTSVPTPSFSDAESDANQQAAASCTSRGLVSKRITPFSDYSDNECQQTGIGYRIPVRTSSASAEFQCVSS